MMSRALKVQMTGTERLFFDMGFGDSERTGPLIATLGETRIKNMGEKIALTFTNPQDVVVFRHRYGVGCVAKTIAGILPFVTLPTATENTMRKVVHLLTKKLRAPSRVHIVLDEIKGIPY